jgi:hypothetical protein
METFKLGGKTYRINPGPLLALGIISEVVESTAPPVTDPVRPDPVGPDPAKPEPVLSPITRADLLGGLVDPKKPNLFRGKGQDVYYELIDEVLWPRPTPTNPNPFGNWAVPGRFTLPPGWGWFPGPSGDGAWGIVPFTTAFPGPIYLLDLPVTEPVRPDTKPVEELTPTVDQGDQAGETEAHFLTTKSN